MKQLIEILLTIAKKLTAIGALIVFLWLATLGAAFFLLREYWTHQETVNERSDARFYYFMKEKDDIYNRIYDNEIEIDSLHKQMDSVLTIIQGE